MRRGGKGKEKEKGGGRKEREKHTTGSLTAISNKRKPKHFVM